MKTTTCDKCGKSTKVSTKGSLSVNMSEVRIQGFRIYAITFDLCDDCTKAMGLKSYPQDETDPANMEKLQELISLIVAEEVADQIADHEHEQEQG